MAKPVTIHFEDQGQDFLEWDIDPKTHKVTGSRPMQGSLWVRNKVTNFEELDIGSKVVIETPLRTRFLIKYPITKIEGMD